MAKSRRLPVHVVAAAVTEAVVTGYTSVFQEGAPIVFVVIGKIPVFVVVVAGYSVWSLAIVVVRENVQDRSGTP